ncbi:MAG: succinate dehydrogenase hydrophobic membrane anchor subunit [Actinomycetota bacterium]
MAVDTSPRRRSAYNRTAPSKSGSSFELWSWWFMRISGFVLVFLVLTHFAIMHIVDEGINRVNFAFVAGRWTSPFWQTFDWLMLFLGMLHGSNGLKNIIHEYVRRPGLRAFLKGSLVVFTATWILLGTLVILTFDPNQAVG